MLTFDDLYLEDELTSDFGSQSSEMLDDELYSLSKAETLHYYNHRRNTHSKGNDLRISGKKAEAIIQALRLDEFEDHRNPIDFTDCYKEITTLLGERVSVREYKYEKDKVFAPIISGQVMAGGFSLEYIFKSDSWVWSVLDGNKRYILDRHDSKPYKLTLQMKSGVGICKISPYKRKRIRSVLLDFLDEKIWRRGNRTDYLEPLNLHKGTWRTGYDVSEYYQLEEGWAVSKGTSKYYLVISEYSFLKKRGKENVFKYDQIENLAIPDGTPLDSEGYYHKVVNLCVKKGRIIKVTNTDLWYDALQKAFINNPEHK